MLISWRACSRACALTDKLGLVKTYQGCLQGKYADTHYRHALVGALQHQATILVIIVAC